jgi:hypothetical protein
MVRRAPGGRGCRRRVAAAAPAAAAAGCCCRGGHRRERWRCLVGVALLRYRCCCCSSICFCCSAAAGACFRGCCCCCCGGGGGGGNGRRGRRRCLPVQAGRTAAGASAAAACKAAAWVAAAGRGLRLAAAASRARLCINGVVAAVEGGGVGCWKPKLLPLRRRLHSASRVRLLRSRYALMCLGVGSVACALDAASCFRATGEESSVGRWYGSRLG